MVITSGDRGGADLMVHVVFRLDSHEWATMEVGARAIMARLASSVAWEMWAVRPCLAAIFGLFVRLFVVVVVVVGSLCSVSLSLYLFSLALALALCSLHYSRE
mmetsp:Transcript_19298/g.42855  ORF Transcript_19298/g.42855 Transcript_19298/m.42855 type:complete len:103 (-) Transcript_19298:230-538(-)